MKVAFDFDGTITAHPGAMSILASCLMAAGHEVIILTAAAGELPVERRFNEVMGRLHRIGWQPLQQFKHLVCCEGHEKGNQCAKLGVDLIIDDSKDYLDLVRVKSPETVRLQVV